MGYIYKITNKETNEVYIGQTSKTIQSRWLEHISQSKEAFDGRRQSFPLFHRMIIKYGKDAFDIQQVEEVDNNLLDEREKYWINYYQSDINGYNGTCGGNYGKSVFQYKGQKVSQFNLQKQFIKTYNNAQEAAAAVHVDASNIRRNCNGDSYQCANSLWQWGEETSFNRDLNQDNKKRPGGRSPVLQYDKEGNLLNEYPTIAAAAKAVNGNSTAISNACNGKSKSSKGYIWKYKFDKN